MRAPASWIYEQFSPFPDDPEDMQLAVWTFVLMVFGVPLFLLSAIVFLLVAAFVA